MITTYIYIYTQIIFIHILHTYLLWYLPISLLIWRVCVCVCHALNTHVFVASHAASERCYTAAMVNQAPYFGPLTVFVNGLFPQISVIRAPRPPNGNYYSHWWMEIAFPLIAQPSVFTASHRSPRPPAAATCTNWADYCKMCFWCPLQRLWVTRRGVGWGAGGWGWSRRWLSFSKTAHWHNKGLMSHIL